MGGLIEKLLDKLRRKADDERTVMNDIAVLFEREYDEFRQEMLSHSKAEIYDDAGKITFYLNIRDYVVYSDELSFDRALKINTDRPMAALWEKYLDTELSPDSYDDIEFLFDLTFPTEKGGKVLCVTHTRGSGVTDPLQYGSGN